MTTKLESLTYDVKNLKIKQSANTNQSVCDKIEEGFLQKYKISFPLKTLEDFIELNKNLTTDIEFRGNLVSF